MPCDNTNNSFEPHISSLVSEMTDFTESTQYFQVRLCASGRACVCVLSYLFCFIVGVLYNGSRDGALPLNKFIS